MNTKRDVEQVLYQTSQVHHQAPKKKNLISGDKKRLLPVQVENNLLDFAHKCSTLRFLIEVNQVQLIFSEKKL